MSRQLRLQIGQSAFDREADELGIRAKAGLGLDQIVIVLDRLQAEIEIGGDLFRGRAGRELPQKFDFPLAQTIERRLRGVEALRRQAMRDVVAHRAFVMRDRPDRPDQRRRFGAFGDIAAGAGVEGSLHQRRLAVHAEDQNARAAVARSDVADRLQSARALHRDVHHHDIRGMGLEGAVGARRAVGLGNYAEVALMVEDAPVALADDRVVVDQQD